MRNRRPNQKISIERGTRSRGRLFDVGDVFLFPDKFNGLSLPLQEAYASGMAVMSTGRYPASQWLPNDPMIPVDGYETRKV